MIRATGMGQLYKKRESGFSLIELMIVVVVLGIVAAIAIPNLLSSLRTTNQASAVSSLRVIFGAQAAYQATTGNGFYAADMIDLGNVGLLDPILGCPADPCAKSGYNFAIDRNNGGAGVSPLWNVLSTPKTPTGVNRSGSFSYYSNEVGVIFFKFGGNAPVAGLSQTIRVPTDGTPLSN